jgi:hypothetical protein
MGILDWIAGAIFKGILGCFLTLLGMVVVGGACWAFLFWVITALFG